MRRTLAKASFHTALNLLFFALIGTALLALTYDLTRDTIKRSEESEKLKLIKQIVPESAYDNDIMQDTIQLGPDELLGTEDANTAYRARLSGSPAIAVIQAVAPDGYGGRINMIMAIRNDGRIGGVRVISHNETPGLGDYIEIAKNEWINVFNDTSLGTRKDADWKVKKDGGTFDYMAGATVTPRAMVKAVHKALQYFALHREALFSAATAYHPNGKKE